MAASGAAGRRRACRWPDSHNLPTGDRDCVRRQVALNYLFAYSAVWGVGGALDYGSWEAFDAAAKELFEVGWWLSGRNARLIAPCRQAGRRPRCC